MSTTAFDVSVRVLECPRCGAPLEGVGEEVRCRFCGAVARVGARDDHPLVAQGSALVDERARMLASRPGPPLPGYGPWSLSPNPPDFSDIQGKSYQDLTPRLQGAWASVRDEFRGAGRVQNEYRAYWLALMLDTAYTQLDDQPRRRAVLESALEMLPGAGCRHVLRCHLAGAAVKLGDITSAEAWLAGCDPNADDEDLAANYLLTSAHVALARTDFGRALFLVGPTLAQAPSPLMRKSTNCAEFRILALEEAGRGDEALAELRASVAELGVGVVGALIRDKRAPETVKRYVASFKVRPVVIAAVVVAALAGIGAVVYFGRGSGVSSGASPPVEDLSGSVVATTGSPPVGRGAACSVAIKPSTSSRYNCRVRVACGDRALYGATSTTGFSHCNVAPGPDGRAAVSALGAGDTTPTGDPGIDLHTATAEVILTDRRPAIPWSMTIHLDPSSQ